MTAGVYTKNMRQVLTYWAPLGNDGFGGRDLADPIVIACRWEQKAQLFRDADGREIVSTAVFYPSQEVRVRGYVALGDQSYIEDPRTIDNADEIRQVTQSPSLNASLVLYKGYLS